MKPLLVLLLSALLIAPLALAEEAFFSEESFETSDITGDEEFFEESTFFAEDDFLGGVAEIAAPPEGTPDGEETENRSLLLLATDGETNTHYLAPEFTLQQGYYAGNPNKLKPGEVKLAWEQKDSGGKTVRKLAKGWKWVVYETEEESGVWLQVATSKKPSITLKNQPVGEHMYIVRPEYKKGNEEIYGLHTGSGMSPWDFRSYCTVSVSGSDLWKTIHTLSVTPRDIASNPKIEYEFTTPDYTASLTDGSTVRYHIRLYGYNGRKKTLLSPTDPSANPSSVSLTEVYQDGQRVFKYFNRFSFKPWLASGILKYEFQITPVIWKGGTVTQTGKTKKAGFTITPESERWKTLAPIITSVTQESFDTVYMVWQHGDWSSAEETPAYYEVYDGKKLITTISGVSADDLHRARIPLSAPGKHRLTVRACSWDKKTRGKTSAVYTFTIPKAEKTVPVIHNAEVKKGSGSYDIVSVKWSNLNPILTDFTVVVIPGQLSALFDTKYWERTESEGVSAHFTLSNLSTTTTAIDLVPNGTADGNRQSYLICVTGFTADGEQQFRSDPIFARYHTEGSGYYTYESVTLKR